MLVYKLTLLIYNIIFMFLFSTLFVYLNEKINYKHEYPKIFIGTNFILTVIVSLSIKDKPYGILLTILFVTLVNIALIDYEYLEIPDSYNLLVFILGIANILILKDFSLIITGIISFILFFIISVISGGALGGGDIKLSLGLGLFFKLSQYLSFIMYTFGIGAVIALVLMTLKKKKREDKIPFGPFMAMGAIISILL